MVVYVRHWQRDQLGRVFPFRLVQRDSAGILLWSPPSTRGWLFDMPDGRRLSETPLSSWSSTRRIPVPHTVNHGTLALHPSGRDFSIRWFFHPDGTFTRWYGNLEAPAALSPNFFAPTVPPSPAFPPAADAPPSPALLPAADAPPSPALLPAADAPPSPAFPTGADVPPSPAADRASSDVAFLDTVDWDLDVVIRPDRTWEWKDEDILTERLAHPDSYWVHDEARVRKAGLSVIALAEAGDFPFDGTWCDFRPDPAWPPLPSELPPGFDAPPHR